MKDSRLSAPSAPPPWRLPFDLTRYDRHPGLWPAEQEVLAQLRRRQDLAVDHKGGAWPRSSRAALARLVAPLDDVLRVVAHGHWRERHATVKVLLGEIERRETVFWVWTREEWITLLQATDNSLRQYAMAVAYLLAGYRDLHLAFPGTKRRLFAWKLFGRASVDGPVRRMGDELHRWGFGKAGTRRVPPAVCELLLRNGSPHLEDLGPELVASLYAEATSAGLRDGLRLAARALVGLGILAASPLPEQVGDDEWLAGTTAATADVPATWTEWCQRWYRTSTLALKSRRSVYYYLLKTGRWLAKTHPEAASPDRWTRELAAEWVAAVDRMKIGEWTHAPTTHRLALHVGASISARTKDRQLGVTRTLFRDCQEWGWIARRFDPMRAFATPRSVRAVIGPDPRVIADDIWARLLWAGLNLTAEDLPIHMSRRASWYPAEMVRAVVVVWLFAGLRVDELARLRVGCVRWQRSNVTVAGSDSIPASDAICLLSVPAHKTGAPFTKPVDRLVGEAILAWEQVRPAQPLFVDSKTGEVVAVLFAYRGRRMSRTYLNRSLIPLLCRKAKVPTGDARGNFTSHRARSTIATQLFNAREPMTLFELQEWLGHRTPAATQQYAKIAPTKLAKAYSDAGYFGRNLRLVEVLIDQEAIKRGAVARDEPWRFYDLGHGHCSYDFFDQCPHRMACAKCAFYRPKDSSQAQLLEAKANLLRLGQEIPLTDEERAAVEDGLVALERLCAQLADVPTPAGPTPRQLGAGEAIQLRPLSTPAASPQPRAKTVE